MIKNFALVSLIPSGARSLMRELSEVLTDDEVMLFAQRYALDVDEDGCPYAVVPAELCRFATEDLIYLDFDDVHLESAVPGEDYGFDGDDR